MTTISVDELQAEHERAERDGIGRETLPFAEPHQLPGYLAGLEWAIDHATQEDQHGHA